MEITFHRSFFQGITLCVCAIILFVVDWVTGHNLFYVHYYLALAGVVSIWIAYKKYAIVNKNGITFYYGPYSREAMILQWADISNIAIGNADMSWIEGFPEISFKASTTVTALKITLKNPLPSEHQTIIRNVFEGCLFPPNEAINELGNEIIIKKSPHGGLKHFIEVASNISGNKYMKR